MEEGGIPHLDIRMQAHGLAKRPLDEALHRSAGIAAEPRRVGDFLPSRHEPFITEVETDDEPKGRTHRICSEEMDER